MQSLLAFLFESGCISAVAAKLFCGLAAAEAFINGFGSWGGNDVLKTLLVDISKGDAAVTIEAAGTNCTVAKNSDMVAQTIAKANFRFRGGKSGPIELIPVLKENFWG